MKTVAEIVSELDSKDRIDIYSIKNEIQELISKSGVNGIYALTLLSELVADETVRLEDSK